MRGRERVRVGTDGRLWSLLAAIGMEGAATTDCEPLTIASNSWMPPSGSAFMTSSRYSSTFVMRARAWVVSLVVVLVAMLVVVVVAAVEGVVMSYSGSESAIA